MATASTSWMPTQGKYPVKIGPSLNRALKARKQGGTPPATNPRRNLPDRDFYSFRYNFKPREIDPTKTGTIEVKKGKEKTQVAVEHSSSQAGDSYVFTGNETQAKEWDVVLIFDDDTGEYTLEKLDSFVNLTWERKQTSAARAPSPVAPSPADIDAEGDVDEELEKELLDLAEDIPLAQATKQKPRPSQPLHKPQPQREEEEEEEEIPISHTQKPIPQLPSKPQPQPAKSTNRPTKPLPKARGSTTATVVEPAPSASATIPSSAAPSKPKANPKNKKRKTQENNPDAEVLTVGKPTKPAKQSAVSAASSSAPATSSADFALPGSSNSGFFQPPPAVTPVTAPLRGTQESAISIPADEDSEVEWEEVANAEPRALSYHSDEGELGDGLFGDDDGEAENEEELAKQLDDELGGDDFLQAALTEEPQQQAPLSLYQLAAADGILEDDSDEDFSSSDDSDED